MVSIGKRMRYVSDNESLSTTDNENSEDMDYAPFKKTSVKQQQQQEKQHHQQRNRCLSKNAIMARENRLRKKRYINNLENENEQLKRDNRKFTKILDNQTILIRNLKKQIKYLKSVLANSDDLLNLIKNIKTNTGMSVTTSLDNNRNLSHSYVYKPKQPKTTTTNKETIWNCIDDNDNNNDDDDELIGIQQNNDFLLQSSFPSPPTDDFDTTPPPIFNDLEFDDTLFNDLTTPLERLNDDKHEDYLNEHNYTTKNVDKDQDDDDDDVGVCLHVSKHRVSLEFCSTCSDNASIGWNLDESL